MLVFSADSKQLISGNASSKDTPPSSLKVWDIATAKELPRLQAMQQNWNALESMPALMCLPPGRGRLLVWETGDAGKFTKIKAYDAATGMLQFDFNENTGRQIQAVSFSADGKIMVSMASNGTIRLVDMEKKGQMLPGGDWFLFDKDGSVGDIALSPDSALPRRLGTGQGGIEDLQSRRQGNATTPSRPTPVESPPAWSAPTAKRIATVGRDDLVKLWDLASGKELHVAE